MNIFKQGLFVCAVLFSMSTQPITLLNYSNKIVNCHEISTGNSCKIVLSCQHDDPICYYDPDSYQATVESTEHRFFMPKMSIEDGIDLPCQTEVYDEGVEVILHGKDVQKIVGGDKILFVVAK